MSDDSSTPLESKPCSNLEDSAFPVSTQTFDERSQQVFSHRIQGGMSFREYVAIELYKALLTNPAYVAHKISTLALRTLAMNEAQIFSNLLRGISSQPTNVSPIIQPDKTLV